MSRQLTHSKDIPLPIDIRSLQLGDMQNLIYLIEDLTTRSAAVIDPAWDVAAILDMAGGAIIEDILVTHWHEDHTNGIDELVSATGARVHLHASEAEYWNVNRDDLNLHNDGDAIGIGEIDLRVMHTPGHSVGSVCFYRDGALFTGDTLFVYGCGRCDLPGGDPVAMFQSLRRLQDMFPADIILYPGHDYADRQLTTLGEQIRHNPFLHQDTCAAFVAFRTEHNKHRHPPYQPVNRGEPAW